jgi:hypothetical protein
MKIASLICAVVLALALSGFAADQPKGKKATLTGELKCAKCALKEGDKCQTVLQVDFGSPGKPSIMTYYLTDNAVAKDFHPKICHETKKGKVTGYIEKGTSKDKFPFFAITIEEIK